MIQLILDVKSFIHKIQHAINFLIYMLVCKQIIHVILMILNIYAKIPLYCWIFYNVQWMWPNKLVLISQLKDKDAIGVRFHKIQHQNADNIKKNFIHNAILMVMNLIQIYVKHCNQALFYKLLIINIVKLLIKTANLH